MSDKILAIQQFELALATEDPFLVTTHHNDAYPRGNDEQGPNVSLQGRNLGQDFSGRDGFSMYHGTKVPGFPVHPHLGFETVTIVLKGLVDHFDANGAYGRYGHGDVQWLTTGRGTQHAEMFPLIHQTEDNPLELFQIWVNLPAASKSAAPEYKMLWAEDIPEIAPFGAKGATVQLIAGRFQGQTSIEPPRASWANDPHHQVGIFLIHLEPNATVSLPPISKTLNRNLYFYQGDTLEVEGTSVAANHRVKLAGDQDILIANGSVEGHLLVLEGEPIREPVAQHGPFVMNTRQELVEAFQNYQRTQFGGWPWGRPDPVNERSAGRFAHYSDGTTEKK